MEERLCACCAQDETFICRCEEVTREEVLSAIEDGAATVTGVKVRTHAGMGLCQGRTCRRLVSQLLAQHGAGAMADILPPTSRPPVRTARVAEFLFEEDDE